MKNSVHLFILVILLYFFNSFLALADSKFSKVCGNYYIEKDSLFFSIGFSDNEKIFICGSSTPGWRSISESQAHSSIKNFLAAEGYFQVKITKKNKKFYIIPGKQSEIKYVQFFDTPPKFFDIKYKVVKGLTLKRSNLDEIAGWTKNRLRSIGYPCPSVKIKTSFAEQKLKIHISAGKKVNFEKIERPQLDLITEEALSRYDAFQLGDEFNGDYLDLTSNRLLASGLVDFTNFESTCENKKIPMGHLKQKVMVSKPNYIIFAAGASTEEAYLLKASWQYNRLNRHASSIFTEAYVSPLKQALNLKIKYYPFKTLPRFHFSPRLNVEKLFEDTEEGFYQTADVGFNYSHDSTNNSFAVSVAPTYTIEEIDEGAAPKDSEYLSIVTKARVTSHYFEYFRASPRMGYEVSLSWATQKAGIQSDFNGNLIKLTGTHLFNLSNFSPPQLVFGIRYEFATLETNNLDLAPQKYRLFLGGDRDLRGFGRQDINNSDKGFLTTSYLGVEPRFTGILPFKLQPYLLLDLAKVGLESFAWEKEQIWSAGIGLRWPSPFGVFRGTASRGFVTDRKNDKLNLPSDGMNYYLSFGREF